MDDPQPETLSASEPAPDQEPRSQAGESDEGPFAGVLPPIAEALAKRGFEALTSVQKAVLAVGGEPRDLRISSQTGSGKTVALGLAIAQGLVDTPAEKAQAAGAHPLALIVTPTRELAGQVGDELAWLLRPVGARVVVVTGGTPLMGDRRALSRSPNVVVGTPGRLVDHLESSRLSLEKLQVVVLDEADQMLDLGFRDELEAILSKAPSERRTHLVSATFDGRAKDLAERYQKNVLAVEGTPLGKASADITHLVYPVLFRERYAAIVNTLLLGGESKSLLFVRTRIDSTELAEKLSSDGFRALAISGDLAQAARTRALAAFKSGAVNVVVATDVAARGIDVPDVARVIHADMPTDPETYVHRSGRTGRAGRQGQSIMLVPSSRIGGARRLLGFARIQAQWESPPSAPAVSKVRQLRLLETLEQERPAATLEVAATLLESAPAEQVVAMLLSELERFQPCAPIPITPVAIDDRGRGRDGDRGRGHDRPREPARGAIRTTPGRVGADEGFMPFHINWGAEQGATPQRLVAMLCRRGKVASRHIGSIRVGPHFSSFQVARAVADQFRIHAGGRDTRDPRVNIRPWKDQPKEASGATRPGAARGPRSRGAPFKQVRRGK